MDGFPPPNSLAPGCMRPHAPLPSGERLNPIEPKASQAPPGGSRVHGEGGMETESGAVALGVAGA